MHCKDISNTHYFARVSPGHSIAKTIAIIHPKINAGYLAP